MLARIAKSGVLFHRSARGHCLCTARALGDLAFVCEGDVDKYFVDMWVKCCCEEAWHDEGGAKHEERAPEGAGLAADGTRTRKTRLIDEKFNFVGSRVDRSLTAQRVRLTTRAGSSLAESAPVRYLVVAHPGWPAVLRGTLLAPFWCSPAHSS